MSMPTFLNRPDLHLTKALTTLATKSTISSNILAESTIVASVDRAKSDGKHLF